MFTVYCSEEDRQKASSLARGAYQRGLLAGTESWTGSTLGGPATEWTDSYEVSRNHLLARLQQAGLELAFENVAGKRILVVGANRPSSWGRLIGQEADDVLDQVRRFDTMPFMSETDPDAHVDFPEKPISPNYTPNAQECPRCKGHGGWNLRLNAYPLHSLEDTAANRHRYAHFRASCPQCNGYGWTDDLACIHDYERAESIAMFQHVEQCRKCGTSRLLDSSG